MKRVWHIKVVEKVVDICAIGGERYYDMIGLVSKCWIGRED